MKITRMWTIASLLLLFGFSNALDLGRGVCQEEQRYAVNVTQHFLRNATVRSYQWCVQIPPRCSTFVNRIIDDTRVIEEERSHVVNVCCEEYSLEASGKRCVPKCPDCVNGKCDEENKCYCHPGYRGDNCEKACEPSRWGRYCRYHCECARGRCDPEDGRCRCPSGWIGARCEQPCRGGYFGEQCKGQCNCGKDEHCNPADGGCHPSQLEKTDQEHASTTKNMLNVRTLDRANDKIEEQIETKLIDLYVLTTDETTEAITTTDVSEEAVTTTATATTTELKGKAATTEVSGTWITSAPEITEITRYDEVEVIHRGHRDSLNSRRILISTSSAVAGTVLFLLLLGLYIKLAKKRTSARTREQEKNASTLQKKSIFHTPLPDPPGPTFENSSFLSPATLPPLPKATPQENQLSVVKTSRDIAELFYDHPPSTGSYRAAAAPEPLYDEIPYWKKSCPENVYINAAPFEDKTRF